MKNTENLKMKTECCLECRRKQSLEYLLRDITLPSDEHTLWYSAEW